jgi:putative endonuclease
MEIAVCLLEVNLAAIGNLGQSATPLGRATVKAIEHRLGLTIVPRTQAYLQPAPYWLYLLECEDGAYYAGIALDVEQRFFRHVFGLGAKFTRARPPQRVLAAREYASKGDALRAEFQLKSLPRAQKLAFFEP